ncbi:MAG: hypothetical protein RSF69_05825 [Erysipelotrichaceae bacterium]
MNRMLFSQNVIPITSDKTNNTLYLILIMLSLIMMIVCIAFFIINKKPVKPCYRGIHNKLRFVKFLINNAIKG